MINKLGFLGFLGALGLLGFFTGESGYYGFFGFFAYFYYFTVIPDEMFCAMVRRAASTGFFTLIAAVALGVCTTVLAGQREWVPAVFALSFAAYVIAFSGIMAVNELRDERGAR